MMGIKINRKYLAAACAAVIAAFATQAVASKLDGAQYLKSARISLEQARATALQTVHGKIVAEELEKEAGGSGLRYSFDIQYQGRVHEVGIDAKNGKVLESGVESDADEAKEADQDRKGHEAQEANEADESDED